MSNSIGRGMRKLHEQLEPTKEVTLAVATKEAIKLWGLMDASIQGNSVPSHTPAPFTLGL